MGKEGRDQDQEGSSSQHDSQAYNSLVSNSNHVPKTKEHRPLNPYNMQQMMQSNEVGTIPHLENTHHMVYQQSLAGVSKMMDCATPAEHHAISSDTNGRITSASSPALPIYVAPLVTSTSQISGQLLDMRQQQPLTISSTHPGTMSMSQPTHPAPTTLGGVSIPPVPPNSSTALQVQAAAAAAAAAAAPPKGFHGSKGVPPARNDQNQAQFNSTRGTKRATNNTEQLSVEQKKELNRERNREHAKSTRARKKAYVNKLKELVDGLHAERSEEAKKRRVAVQHLAEKQRVRRAVIQKFLSFHSRYESDSRKWMTMLEDSFFLKQPVTPYRSFRRIEIENTNYRECRKSKGIEAVICDSASMSVMVDNVGSRSIRWQHIKRDEFLRKEASRTGAIQVPRSIVRQDSRMQHAISSLSSNSGYTTGTGSGEEEDKKRARDLQSKSALSDNNEIKVGTSNKVSSSSSRGSSREQIQESNNDYHDYHAQPLPDPKLDSGRSSGSVGDNDSDNAVAGENLCTDSSSGDEEKPQIVLKVKRPLSPTLEMMTEKRASKAMKLDDQTKQPAQPNAAVTESLGSNSSNSMRYNLPANIAGSGGIIHHIRPVEAIDSNPRLNAAPVVPIPPFLGIGKRPGLNVVSVTSNPVLYPKNSLSKPVNSSRDHSSSHQKRDNSVSHQDIQPSTSQQSANIIDADNDAGLSDESEAPQIQAFYHVNEDDMLLTDDVLMCPFIFRTQDAVLCGALAECIMPGMLRAQFSQRNKLLNLEMVYDAMGFMQQIGRASGNEGVAEIIPNSLEMSLQPNSEDARVITTAKSPFQIVSANASFTKMTKYTQMEVERKDLSLLEGKRTSHSAKCRPGKPSYDPVNIANGKPACSTNIYHDKFGRPFVAFVCSYPLTNEGNHITHILHVYKELPKL